jgi:peptidoglycan/LPS O-acetylase OafA/YrhL
MKHNNALDGIRALAVIMVLGFHAAAPGATGGYLGVDVFFVLSGFLITSLLIDEMDSTGTVAFGRFYLRRCLRLTPPLLLMLAAYLAFAPIAWPQMAFHTDVRDVLISTFYLSDYASAFWSLPHYLRHTWSLSVEWHFYFIWPLFLLSCARRMSRVQLCGVLAAAYLVFTAWRVYCELDGSGGYTHSYYRFDTRLSGLTAGSLLAMALPYLRTRESFRRLRLMANGPFGPFDALAVLALLAIAVCSWRFHVQSNAAMVFGITVVEVAAVVLVYLCLVPDRSRLRGWLAHPVASYVGKVSYGIYLWHYPIFVYAYDRYPWYVVLFGGGLIAFALAVISYHTVEKVARRYSRQLREPAVEPPVSAPRSA